MQIATMWAAYDDYAVWGTGPTAEAARANAIEWLDRDTAREVAASLSVAIMTPELIHQVDIGGSAAGHGLMPDGRLGGREEWIDEHFPDACLKV